MDYGTIIHRLWRAVSAQDRAALAGFFTEDAVILWPNTGEAFTLPEYLRANCDYPGQWAGQVLMGKGSTYMKSRAGVDSEIASVITGIILLFSACNVYLKHRLEKREREKASGGKEEK